MSCDQKVAGLSPLVYMLKCSKTPTYSLENPLTHPQTLQMLQKSRSWQLKGIKKSWSYRENKLVCHNCQPILPSNWGSISELLSNDFTGFRVQAFLSSDDLSLGIKQSYQLFSIYCHSFCASTSDNTESLGLGGHQSWNRLTWSEGSWPGSEHIHTWKYN